jgi:hypothetical protein
MVECELARERVSGTPAAVAALIWSRDVSFDLGSQSCILQGASSL